MSPTAPHGARPLPRPTLARGALVLVALLAAFVFFAPRAPAPSAVASLPGLDLLVHAGIFALLGLLLPRGFPYAPRAVLAAWLVAAAFSTELVQLALPARTPSLLDLAANLVGALTLVLRRPFEKA